ncbi:MAG: DegV family protein [Lachnospiraceae bacterium]
MNKIKFITDTASDAQELNLEDVIVLPMTIHFGDQEYEDGVTISHREFYEKLIESDELPKTSQIAPLEFEKAMEQVTSQGDTAIVITLSSKLSGTYQSAMIAAAEFEKDVYVIDSENVAVGECVLLKHGLELAAQGRTAQEIVSILEGERKDIHTIALLETLEYLKKGGRISKTAAFAGNLLSIKPVVGVVDGEVAVLGKARGSKQGNNLLMQEIEKAGGVDFARPIYLGYTGLDDSAVKKYAKDSEAVWKESREELTIISIGSTIGTHVGPGAIAVSFFAKG